MANNNPLLMLPGVWESYVLIANTCNQIISERLIDELRRTGLDVTPREMWIMMATDEKEVSQRYVSRALNINANVMVRLVDGLEKKKMIKRVLRDGNRHKSLLELTPKGRDVLSKLYGGWAERIERAFYPVPLAEVKKYAEVGRKIITAYYNENKKGPARRLAL